MISPAAGAATVCYPAHFVGSELLLAFQTGFAARCEAEIRSWNATLARMQFLALDPTVLRQYGSGGPVRQMGERGENFASVVKRHSLSDLLAEGWLETAL